MILQHDNARRYTINIIKAWLRGYSPYSPDPAPTDFHFFLLFINIFRNAGNPSKRNLSKDGKA